MTDKEAKAILIDKVKHCLNGTEWEMALDIAIKSLEQEPCDDAISRSDMLDAIGHGTTYTSEDLQGIIKGLPSVNPQPCEDAISRQAAIETVMDLCKHYTPTKSVYHPHMDFVIEELQDLPPVNPQPKTGHWTIKQYQVPIENKQVPTVSGITFLTEPTACKIIYTYTHSDCKSEEYLNKYNYCPNCGARMAERSDKE